MSRKILGLDIRDQSVSAVLVSSSIKGIVVESCSYVTTSGQNGFESNISTSLETILGTMDIEGSTCIASFPAGRISYRNLNTPFKDKKRIHQILPFELEATLPFQVDDLVLDFHTIKLPGHDNHNAILAAAAEKEKIGAYLDILSSFGIKPEIVTPGGYCAALSLACLATTPDNWLFADIDPYSCTLIAVVSDQIIIIRSFTINSVPSAKAESLCRHISHTLSGLEEMLEYNVQPEGIFITGCGLDGGDFEQIMQKTLNLPVRRLDLIHDTEAVKKNYALQAWRPERMDNALALTMIETAGLQSLNFRRGSFAAAKPWTEHKKKFIHTGILLSVVLLLAFFNMVMNSYTQQKKLHRLNTQINDIFQNTFPEIKTIVDPLQQMRVKIQEIKKASIIRENTKDGIRSIDILYDISRLIPNQIDVDFSQLVVASESVLISGETDTFKSVDDIKSNLEKSTFFKNVTITSSNMEKSGNRVRFKLKVQL